MSLTTRRAFLKTAAASAAAAAIPAPRLHAQPAGRKPNVIYILADDLGYADLGCYGQKLIQTPNIDRLAAQGIRFTEHYSGSAACAPARCTLMTGLHTGHCTRRGNRRRGEPLIPLKDADVTLAEMLREAGYVTGMTGKWGLGNEGTSGEAMSQGWDAFYGYLDQVHAHDHYTDHLWHNHEKIALPENVDGNQGQYVHDLFGDWALQFIREHRDRPFFLYFASTMPHGEYVVPEAGPYADQPWTDKEKAVAEMVSRLDAEVGRILDLLDELGLARDTLVMFASDNGPVEEFVFDSNGPLRGFKRDLYEGGIRVPMIARWTGRIAPGRTTDHASAFWDVMPTLAEVTGASLPGRGTDGLSFLPVLLDRPQPAHELLYWEGYGHQVVRQGRYKGMLPFPGKDGVPGPFELYDLQTDIGETTNIADQHPQLVAQLRELMQREHTYDPNWPLWYESGKAQ